jgi:1-acyl-sn-glycerol-3-phosphate acyltransferase
LIQKIFYQSLKKYTTAALKFYFKQWQVREVVPIPSGPVIFVSNHQNAFLDAVLIVCSSYRNPWFLTRANVFTNSFAKKVLTWMQMSPVYRFRDGFSTLRKNDEVIDNCVQLLTQQQSIAIFGEGNHNDQWYLRPLQKGFARIALAAEEKNNWELNLKIVPVGIQYESHTDFRSRVLVSFGSPISVKENYNSTLSAQENSEMLIQETSKGIKSLILHIDHDHYLPKFNYWRKHREIKTDLIEQLKSDQKLVDDYTHSDSISTSKEEKKQTWWNPIRVYESINHFPSRIIVRWVLQNKVKDPQFIGSIKFALGMFLVPLFYFIQTGLCFAVSQSWPISLAYFVSLPLSVMLRR